MTTKCTPADFTDDVNSVNSVELREDPTHLRYQVDSSKWQQKTTLQKILPVLVATLFFVIIISLIIYVPLYKTNHELKKSNVLEALDLSVDPCTDFYSYSCNGWIKSNPIPVGQNRWNPMMKLQQQNQLVIKRILERPTENLSSEAERKAKIYYESCMDEATIEELGAKPLTKLIRELGGWSITDTGFNPESWSLQNLIELVQIKYEGGALFACSIEEDPENPSRHIMGVGRGLLSLNARNYYLMFKYRHIFETGLEYMTTIGVLLGGDPKSTKEQMENVLEFETKLANVMTSPRWTSVVTIGELSLRAKYLDWRRFFENFNRKVSPEERIAVHDLEYLESLSNVIEHQLSTVEGITTLNNYIVWQTVRSVVHSLSKAFRKAARSRDKAWVGSDSEGPRWQDCVQDTTGVFGLAVGSVFVREAFDPDTKRLAEDMLNNVRNELIANFAKLSWMDEETRHAAIIKARAITNTIGYPEFIRDPKQLDKWYQQLEVRKDAFFENTLNKIVYRSRRTFELVIKPVNKTLSSLVPSEVNAYYSPNKNRVEIPAGFLRRPFYDPTFPPSLNYGAIGATMGHELTHGFDNRGSKYDENGNVNGWWTNRTFELFESHKNCFVGKYSQYDLYFSNVNGDQTINENLADNGGLKIAYLAYLTLMKNKPEPPPLPGLPLNHRQLFFVAFAQNWCSSVREEIVPFEMEYSVHSPDKFRVIGALSNFKEFSDVFNCPSGWNMNPKYKCEVW